MTRNASRYAPLLVTVAVVWLFQSACSDDSPVDTSPTEPFKQRTCFDFADYLHAVSLVETSGWAVGIDGAGGLTYVAVDNRGLQIMDYGDPASPVFLGRVATPAPAVDVAAAGGVACLTLGAAGVAVVDAGDPDRPIVVARLDTPGDTEGISLRDTMAYVADDVAGLMLIDIADPSSPRIAGVDNTPGWAVDVAVSGAFAYVADRQRGLKVVNVNNPSDPWWVDDVALPDGGRGVAVAGRHAFVAAGSGGLQIADVSTPGGERVVGSASTKGSAEAVALSSDGSAAFVVEGLHGLEVFDVSDPGAPRRINGLSATSEMRAVFCQGPVTVLAAGGDDLQALVTASPQPPPVEASLAGYGTHVAAAGGQVFAFDRDNGLFGVEVQQSTLRVTRTLSLDYGVNDLYPAVDTLFLAADGGGIAVVDAADPATLDPAGWVPYQGGVASLDGSGRLLCFAGGRIFGTWVWGEPQVTTVDVNSSGTSAVAVHGDYAYVGNRAGELRSVDIHSPGRPLVISTKSTEGGIADIVAAAGKLFLATYSRGTGTTRNGVGVYDLSLPVLPEPTAFVPLLERPGRLALSGDIVYAVAGGAGTTVIDFKDPANPIRIGTIPSGDAAMGVAVSGGSVFVADGSGGLFTLHAQGCVPSP